MVTAVRTELYFGEIQDQAWARFLAREVTPRFPDGLTWIDAHGQWREVSGSISKEHSRLLILIHREELADERKIEEIRSAFVKMHGHESVLRVSQPVRTAF